MWWLGGFSTAPGAKVEDYGEGSLRLLPAGTENFPGNPGARIPVDPCPLFESGEMSIHGVFRICRQGVVGGRDLTV